MQVVGDGHAEAQDQGVGVGWVEEGFGLGFGG